MFLLSNLARTGLDVDEGKPFQATYAGAFRGDELVGVAASCWNGMVLVQAPTGLRPLAVAVQNLVERPLSGIAGPHLQVQDAIAALKLTHRRTTLDSNEILYALTLNQLSLPAEDLDLQVRKARPSDVTELASWSVAFQIESLGVGPGSDLEEYCLKGTRSGVSRGHIWVGCVGPQIVSMSGFNATLPERVQLGGVYTPPGLRSRGYSRRVIAESLRAVRSEGVYEAILFTDQDNLAAQACYESLGFKNVGQYGLVQFAPSLS